MGNPATVEDVWIVLNLRNTKSQDGTEGKEKRREQMKKEQSLLYEAASAGIDALIIFNKEIAWILTICLLIAGAILYILIRVNYIITAILVTILLSEIILFFIAFIDHIRWRKQNE